MLSSMRPETHTVKTDFETQDLDRPASAMDWVIGLAAASMSWAAWTGLAEKCGHTQTLSLGFATLHLSWLTALMIDIYAMRAFRSWLRSGSWVSESTRRYAMWSTLVAVGVGIGGNIAYHVLETLKIETAPVWVTVLVSGLAPIALGAIGHLRALERRDRAAWSLAASSETQTQGETSRVKVETRKPVVSRPVSAPTVETPARLTKTESRPETSVETETGNVVSLPARSADRAEQIQMIKDGFQADEIDWISRPPINRYDSVVTDAEITKYTGVTGKATMGKLREILRAERDAAQATPQASVTVTEEVPSDARELVGAI